MRVNKRQYAESSQKWLLLSCSKLNGGIKEMETAGQNTKQVMEENDALKQLIELLNQQDMKEQSQDFMGVFWYGAGMQVQLAAIMA